MNINNSTYSYYNSVFTPQSAKEQPLSNSTETNTIRKTDEISISDQGRRQAQIEQFLADKPATRLYYQNLSNKNTDQAETFINQITDNYDESEFKQFDAMCASKGIINSEELNIELNNIIAIKKSNLISRKLVKTEEFLSSAKSDNKEHGYMTGTYLNQKVFSLENETSEWDKILEKFGPDLEVFSENLEKAEKSKNLINFAEDFINSLTDEQKSAVKKNNSLAHPTFAGMKVEGIDEFTKQYDEIPGYLKSDEPYSYYNADGAIAEDAVYRLKNIVNNTQFLYIHECTKPVIFGDGLFLKDNKENIVLATMRTYDADARLTSEELQESLKRSLGEPVYNYIQNGLKNGFYGDHKEVKELLENDIIKTIFDGADPSALYEKYPPTYPPYPTAIPEGETTVIADENTVLVFPSEIFKLPENWEEGAIEHEQPEGDAQEVVAVDTAVKELQKTESIDSEELGLGESFIKYIKHQKTETSLLNNPEETERSELISKAKKLWLEFMKTHGETKQHRFPIDFV